jgi:indole-3-glycerol phosphate synthase
MNFLEKIISEIRPPRSAKPSPFRARNLRETILSTRDRIPLIAEIKFRSPSGVLREPTDPAILAEQMVSGGAIALSVLTEEKYFGGHPSFVTLVRRRTGVPVLRKDFIVYESQLYESSELQADAVLLIAAALKGKLKAFIELTRDLGMTPVVEVGNKHELELAVEAGADVLGINNRDLRTLQVDLNRTVELAPLVPEGVTVISESGISSPSDARRMLEAGADAVLVGTAIMRSPDVRRAVEEMVRVGKG